jgi:glycosyltransferase involved in cell wall biosynthesis
MFSPGGERSPTPMVMALGRLVPVKRYHCLIRAVAEARRRHPQLTLTIVGVGYERENLDHVVREVEGSDWVTFAGHVSDAELVDLYRRAWLVSSASAREGWGMSITEAAACGTPAVVTRIPGHVDAVVDGETGILVDRDDEAALGRAIGDLVADNEQRAGYGAAALTRSAAYSWEATAAGIMRVLAAEAERHRR